MTRLLALNEREDWDAHGFLLVRGALAAGEVARALAAVQALDPDACADATFGHAGNVRDVCVLQALSALPELDVLLDHPSTFGRILGLMGPYISVTGTEVLVRIPDSEVLHPLHTDGGPSLARIFPEPASSVLTLKVQFFLTDTIELDTANMVVVPGSHRRPFPRTRAGFEEASARGQQILAAAGDAVIFPWSLWHGAARHMGGSSRVSVVLRYSQLWSRPVDYTRHPPRVLDRMTPRRRRLLGDLGPSPHPGDYYRPVDGRQLELIFGDEWAGMLEATKHAESEAFSRALYTPAPPLAS